MQIPQNVTKYFWGDNLSALSQQDHIAYIAQTILEKGDEQALKWLFSIQSKDQIRTLLPTLSLSPKSANFWRVYLSD